MMYINKNNNSVVKTLLSLNPRIFQAAHRLKGFDFTRPFNIISGDGKFTLNTIKKACENAGVTTMNAEIILFMEINKNTYYYNDKLYVVNICQHKFVQYETRDLPYKCNLDNFYSIGKFEDIRKNYTKRWFVIVQKKEYITKIKPKKGIDFTERMKPIGKYTMWRSQDGSKHGFSSGEFKQGNKTYYINRNCTINTDNPIDKSGYWLLKRQEELRRKAKELKTQRLAAKAAVYNCNTQTEKIKEHINELRKILSDLILNDDYIMVNHVIWNYRSLFDDYKRHLERIKNNSYKSIEQINNSLFEMERLYSKIINEIKTDREIREVS